MDYQAVIPEFVVSNIEKSRSFYCDLLGFSVEYERPEEKFLFLSLEDCQLMLEEGDAEELAQLTYPFGRGINISFGIEDVPQLHQNPADKHKANKIENIKEIIFLNCTPKVRQKNLTFGVFLL